MTVRASVAAAAGIRHRRDAESSELLFASLMADNAAEFCGALVDYLARRLGVAVRELDAVDWQERERMLYRGEAQLGVVCGLQYVYAVDRGERPGIDLLAAPVMRGERYRGRPIYFSDVVVRRDSPARCLADLRGASWAYNEPTSQSGYNLPRYVLASRGETAGFFGRVVASGAHQRSLELILDGAVDAAAIDSTVLERELELHPELAERLRVIEILGPSAIPPLVVSRAVPRSRRADLLRLVLEMHDDPAGSEVLAEADIVRFVRVSRANYDQIRQMARVAASARL
jgi:phosphonate transport system substrate-binding protein